MAMLKSGRLYRVTGANSRTGEDVEITVEAHDEADAARVANRQGVFVSRCVPAGPDGSNWASAASAPSDPAPAAAANGITFAEVVARDPVVQKLVRTHPELAGRIKRLNKDDQEYFLSLVTEEMGISYRDSAHVANLMRNAGHGDQA